MPMNNIYKYEIILRVNIIIIIITIMVMDNNDRAQRACILLADYEPLYFYVNIIYYIADAH
jgi:hypothetical protein